MSVKGLTRKITTWKDKSVEVEKKQKKLFKQCETFSNFILIKKKSVCSKLFTRRRFRAFQRCEKKEEEKHSPTHPI